MLRKILDNKDGILMVMIVATLASVIIYNIVNHGI
jgi:hypothetical protein